MKVARWTPRRTELSRRFFAIGGAVALVRRVWEDGDFCRDRESYNEAESFFYLSLSLLLLLLLLSFSILETDR